MNFNSATETINTLSVFIDDMMFLVGIAIREDLEFNELLLSYENQIKEE